MGSKVQLVPRNGHTLHVLVVARTSGCGRQKEVSLDDQIEHARQDIAELYTGEVEFHSIATKAKGERLDRPELAEVESLILQGEIDVVYMEDVGRLIRGAAAVELWGMAVGRGIRCIDQFDEQLRLMVEQAMAAPSTAARELEAVQQEVQQEEERLKREERNLIAAVRQAGSKPSLEAAIDEIEGQMQNLVRQRAKLERQLKSKRQLPSSAAELRTEFEQAFGGLATDSFEFGDLLRQVVPDIHVYLIRCCAGGHFLPRACVRLTLGGLVTVVAGAPGVAEVLNRELTIDLFDQPQHVRLLNEAVQLRQEGRSQRDIAKSLGVCQWAISNTLQVNGVMQARGLESPYVLVTDPPSCEDEYKKLRRHFTEKYRFTPVPGYVLPRL